MIHHTHSLLQDIIDPGSQAESITEHLAEFLDEKYPSLSQVNLKELEPFLTSYGSQELAKGIAALVFAKRLTLRVGQVLEDDAIGEKIVFQMSGESVNRTGLVYREVVELNVT